MATMGAIADAFVETINTATSIRAFAYVPDDINPPTCFVTPANGEVGAFALGQMDAIWNVVVFTSKASDRVGQTSIYEYLSLTGSKSILAALIATPTLGLSNVSVGSHGWRQLGIDEIAAYGYYGVLFEYLVLTSGA